MREKHLINHETHKELERDHERHSVLRDYEHKNETLSEDKKHELIERTRNETEKLYSESKQDIQEKIRQNLEDKESHSDKSIPTNSYLKGVTLSNELRHIQRKLNPLDKLGSQFIHQKGISKASELTSNTIFRASGVLGGGFLAFIGTFAYYYYAKHTGLTYNYLVALMFFLVGFLLGLAIELIIRLFRPLK